MNDYCRELNFPSDFYPKIDVSKYDTEGYSWVQFHKVLQPEELNNEPLFEYLKSLGMCSYWIELFYTPPNDDGVIHCDNNKWEKSTKIYFQYGALGSTMRWWDSSNVIEIDTGLVAKESKGIVDYRDITEEHNHGQVFISEEKDSSIIYEKDLSTPHLVNVGKLHSSHNPTNEKRFVLTIALHDLEGNRILWDDAILRLSKNML